MHSAQADILASGQIKVGDHETAHLFGMDFNVDTILSTSIAAVIVIGLALFLRARITAGVPNGVQLFFESVTTQMRDQIENSIGMKVAPFALPVAVTLFTFILISNWLSVLPLQYGDGELVKPPASDVNFVYALALFVFAFYHLAGAFRRGLFTHLKMLVK